MRSYLSTRQALPEVTSAADYDFQVTSVKFSASDFAFSAGSAVSVPEALLCLLLALRAPDLDILSHFPGLLPRDLERCRAHLICRKRTEEYGAKYCGQTTEEQLEALMPAVTEIMTEILTDKSNKYTGREKADAAKWAWEQVKGKATQKQGAEAEVTLSDIFRQLDEMRTERETPVPGSDSGQPKSNHFADSPKSAAQKWANNIPKETA